MKINRNNYEQYFLDYFENQLNKSDIKILFEFLENNPDLKSEFEEFEIITLPEEKSTSSFSYKEQLKKPELLCTKKINESNYHIYFIAWHEGDLLPEEQQELMSFINSNPQLDQEFELFGKLKLQADQSIIFSSKHKLYHKSQPKKIKLYIQYAVSTAAAFLILFTVFQHLNSPWKQDFQTAGLYMQSSDPGFDLQNNQSDVVINQTNSHFFASNYPTHSTPNSSGSLPAPKSVQSITASRVPENNTPILSHTPSFRNEFSETYAAMIEIQKNAPYENIPSLYEQPRLFDNVIAGVQSNYNNISNKIADINGWKIAEYGMMGFNVLTNNSIDFNVQNNDQDEVSKVAFNDFAIPVRRNR